MQNSVEVGFSLSCDSSDPFLTKVAKWHLAYSLLELVFVRSRSFSVSKDFADTDIQTMIDALCTA